MSVLYGVTNEVIVIQSENEITNYTTILASSECRIVRCAFVLALTLLAVRYTHRPTPL